MSSIYFTLALVMLVLCGIFLILSVVLFFSFRIPTVVKDLRGSLERKQIEEIRIKSDQSNFKKGSVNVFEEIEQKAKPRKGNTQRIKLSNTTDSILSSQSDNEGTTVLQKSARVINPDFRIEKNIIFVCTTDVLS